MADLLAQHHAWLVFFGSFLFGETLIIPAAAIAAQGHFSVLAVAGWAYLGTVVSDGIWFVAARPLSRLLERSEQSQARSKAALNWISKRFGDRPERALLFIKFVYGTRIATIVYLSVRKLALRVFVAYNSVGTGLWIVVIVSIGWLAGRGIANLQSSLTKIEYLLPVAIILALGLKGLVAWLSKRAIEK